MNKRLLLYLCGWLSLILGVIGIFLPIMPTAPFAILAAWCFSKSSERWHQWLIGHKIFGPTIVDWHTHGVIRMKVKIYSTCMIILLFANTIIFVKVNLIIKSIVCGIGIAVLAFIWSRPSQPKSVIPNDGDR